MKTLDLILHRLCANCGLTWGAHRGDDRCPGHQSMMDWEHGAGTTFVDSGELGSVPYGTPAKNAGGVA